MWRSKYSFQRKKKTHTQAKGTKVTINEPGIK